MSRYLPGMPAMLRIRIIAAKLNVPLIVSGLALLVSASSFAITGATFYKNFVAVTNDLQVTAVPIDPSPSNFHFGEDGQLTITFVNAGNRQAAVIGAELVVWHEIELGRTWDSLGKENIPAGGRFEPTVYKPGDIGFIKLPFRRIDSFFSPGSNDVITAINAEKDALYFVLGVRIRSLNSYGAAFEYTYPVLYVRTTKQGPQGLYPGRHDPNGYYFDSTGHQVFASTSIRPSESPPLVDRVP